MKEVYWLSPPPEHCDLCNVPIKDIFIDGKTEYGPWACMCPTCHGFHGYSLGTNRGQKYKKDGLKYKKIEG